MPFGQVQRHQWIKWTVASNSPIAPVPIISPVSLPHVFSRGLHSYPEDGGSRFLLNPLKCWYLEYQLILRLCHLSSNAWTMLSGYSALYKESPVCKIRFHHLLFAWWQSTNINYFLHSKVTESRPMDGECMMLGSSHPSAHYSVLF
jgi:hypothetical protein